MFSFKKLNAEKIRQFTPVIAMIAVLAMLFPVIAANSYTEVYDFASFKSAMTAGGNVRLMDNIEDTENGPVELYNDVTLDLNGYSLSKKNISTSEMSKNRYFIIARNGTLTIENSLGTEQYGEIFASGDRDTAAPRTVGAVTNADGQHPKLIINSGVNIVSYNAGGYEMTETGCLAVNTSTSYETDEYANATEQSAEVIINEGAKIESTKTGVQSYGYGAKLTINGGKIIAGKWAVGSYCGAKTTINNGIFKGRDRGGVSNELAETTINGGEFSSTNSDSSQRRSIGNYWTPESYPGCTAKSIVNITGGTFTGSISSDNPGENLETNITGGKFSEDPTWYLDPVNYTANYNGSYYLVKAAGVMEIATKADLEEFRDMVSNGSVYLKAKLTTDIDLQGSESNQWTPISGFAGEFDGNGHKISGIYINNSKDDQGLFGCVGNATIKNLTVSG